MNKFVFIADNEVDLFNADIPQKEINGNEIFIPSSSSSDSVNSQTSDNTYMPFVIASVAVILVIVAVSVLFKNLNRTKYAEITAVETSRKNNSVQQPDETPVLKERPVTVKKSSYATPSSVSAAITLFLEKTKNK